MIEMTVANTILQQLGGSRFVLMTGARNLIYAEDLQRVFTEQTGLDTHL